MAVLALLAASGCATARVELSRSALIVQGQTLSALEDGAPTTDLDELMTRLARALPASGGEVLVVAAEGARFGALVPALGAAALRGCDRVVVSGPGPGAHRAQLVDAMDLPPRLNVIVGGSGLFLAVSGGRTDLELFDEEKQAQANALAPTIPRTGGRLELFGLEAWIRRARAERQELALLVLAAEDATLISELLEVWAVLEASTPALPVALSRF